MWTLFHTQQPQSTQCHVPLMIKNTSAPSDQVVVVAAVMGST